MIAYAKVFGGGDNIKTDNEINKKKLCRPDASGLGQALVSGCFGVHNDINLCSVTHALLIAWNLRTRNPEMSVI